MTVTRYRAIMVLLLWAAVCFAALALLSSWWWAILAAACLIGPVRAWAGYGSGRGAVE